MHSRTLLSVVLGLAVAGFGSQASSQTEDPIRIENDLHGFAFTVMASSVVTYEEGGDGFSAVYNSQGGGKGTHPDYGLIVYGTGSHRFSAEEAQAAGFDTPGEVEKTPADFSGQGTWQSAYSAQMALHTRGQGGLASVTLADGQSIEVPYFQWSVVAGMRKAHALTYVLLHTDSFVHVQVESSEELSPENAGWLVSQLELLAASNGS